MKDKFQEQEAMITKLSNEHTRMQVCKITFSWYLKIEKFRTEKFRKITSHKIFSDAFQEFQTK